MPKNDNDLPLRQMAEEPFGQFVFHAALPGAIRSLDDDELRILLIALLQEWRGRAELAKGPV
jgi:hypothetical protein